MQVEMCDFIVDSNVPKCMRLLSNHTIVQEQRLYSELILVARTIV